MNPVLPVTVKLPIRAEASTSSAPLRPALRTDSEAVALPVASVKTELRLNAAKVPFTVLRSTTAPATPFPRLSRTVTVTSPGATPEIALGDTATDTDMEPVAKTCTAVCAVAWKPPTVALAVSWSAPLLPMEAGVSVKRATPLAFVSAVGASKPVNPKVEASETNVPAGTALPAASLTSTDSVAGLMEDTSVLLAVIVSVGSADTSCTDAVACSAVPPTAAEAVSVSAAVTAASATVMVTWATPLALVRADGLLKRTRPPVEPKTTGLPATAAPVASRNTADSTTAPSEARKVVAADVRDNVDTLPATVKLAFACTVAVPMRAVPTTWSAPPTPAPAAVSVVVAVPSARVAKDATPSRASPPRVVVRSTTTPDTGLPRASRAVTVTVDGEAAEKVTGETDTSIVVDATEATCSVILALVVT